MCAYDRAGLGRMRSGDGHALGRRGGRGPPAGAGHRRRTRAVRPRRPFAGVSTCGCSRTTTTVSGVVLVDAFFPDASWLEDVTVDPGVLLVTRRDGLDGCAHCLDRAPRLAGESRRAGGFTAPGDPDEVLAVDQHLRYDDPRLPPKTEEAVVRRIACVVPRTRPARGTTHAIVDDRLLVLGGRRQIISTGGTSPAGQPPTRRIPPPPKTEEAVIDAWRAWCLALRPARRA